MAIHKFTVAGRAHLRDDETKQDVAPGGVVGLDDSVPGRSIDALMQAGHIKPLEAPKPAAKKE